MTYNEEAVKSTFDKYLFHLVKLGEIAQKRMKQIDEDKNYCRHIIRSLQINVYNLLKDEFKKLVKDIDVVFNESFTIDKYNWILKFKERYLDFNKRYIDIATRLDIHELEIRKKFDEALDEDSIDITEEEARSDGGLEEEYLGTDEDEDEYEDYEDL